MKHKITIHKDGETIEKNVTDGTNLLDFLRKHSIDVNASCSGNGTCGKCKVRVSGLLEEPSGKEKKALGEKAKAKGYRLACYSDIHCAVDIYMDEIASWANIAVEGAERAIKLKPALEKKVADLKHPSLDDQRPDMERVMEFFKKPETDMPLEFLRVLPNLIRSENFKSTFVYFDKKLISIEPGDTTGKLFGIAVDVGTTTIAAYLVNLISGEKVDVYSLLNPQKEFGADVISRIKYTMSSSDSLSEMNMKLIDCLNGIIGQLASRNNIDRKDIYTAVFVGNTTMMHFLMRLPAANMAVSPFIPVTRQMHKLNAKKLGIDINTYGNAVIFPSISAYVGADTIAAVLSSGMYDEKKISLLIDIGTNGEIVLGNSKWLLSCSVAAGPAFEGAHLRNGVGGVNGAIDKISFDNSLKISTIGNEKAIGICGSGIVDAAAVMLLNGIMDESGRIAGTEEADSSLLSPELAARLVNIDGTNSFLILKSEECAADMDIAITQKDIREFQNAKAAIAAGIKALVRHGSIKLRNIDRVYLAGGFGSFMNKESALKVGLIPAQLEGKVHSIGNAAGSGAIEGLMCAKSLEQAEKLLYRIKYIELSNDEGFQEEFIENMRFTKE